MALLTGRYKKTLAIYYHVLCLDLKSCWKTLELRVYLRRSRQSFQNFVLSVVIYSISSSPKTVNQIWNYMLNDLASMSVKIN